MLELALAEPSQPHSLTNLAQRQDISAKYLEQLLIPLKAAGMVKSTRGAHGGYTLAKPTQDITLYDIVRTLEGSITLVDCVDSPEECSRHEICVVRQVWEEMSNMISEFLNRITLSQLVEKHLNQN
jgi:Rrf2 family protein